MSARRLLALPTLLLVAAFAPAASGQQASGAVGTLDTIAGPGVCDGPTAVDPASLEVGGLAVGSEGTVWYEVGSPERALLARVNDRNEVRLLDASTGTSGAPDAEERISPTTSRIASGGASDVIVATHTDLYRFTGVAELLPGQPGAFNHILSIATDGQGNVLVADELEAGSGAYVIRFLNRSGQAITFYQGSPDEVVVAPGAITTIAGDAGRQQEGGGDSLRGLIADLQGQAPAMAAEGSLLYIASVERGPEEEMRSSVRVVNVGSQPASAHGVTIAPGEIEAVAGGTAVGFGGDGGPARAAQLGEVPGIGVAGGSLYLADQRHHRVRRVDPAGVITTVVGVGGTGPSDGGFNGNGRPGDETRLNEPFDVEVGTGGALYISDRGNGQVRSLDVSGTVRAMPGSGSARRSMCVDADEGDDEGVGGEVRRGGVHGVAPNAGEIFVANLYQPDLKRVGADGTVTRIAGLRSDEVCLPSPPGCPIVDGPAESSRLDSPGSVAVRPGSGVYVYDEGSRRVRFVNLRPGPVTLHGVEALPGHIVTVAGDGGLGGGGDGGPARAAQLSGTGSVTFDEGDLLIADAGNGRVRRVDEVGVISTLIGESEGDGCCQEPVDVAVDPSGNLFVVDAPTSIPTDLAIAPVDLTGEPPNRVFLLNRGEVGLDLHGQTVPPGELRAVAGSGGIGVANEGGAALESQLLHPVAVAVGQAGDLFIADDADNTILRVDSAGIITTVAGIGTFGFNGDGLPGALSALSRPSDLAMDACGNLLVADFGNDRVRRLNLLPPCTPSPSSAVQPGGGFPFRPSLYVFGVLGVVAAAVALRRVGRTNGG